MVQGLGDLLPYQDQHDPNYCPTMKLCLAWIHEELVLFHSGPLNTVLEANENAALPEEILPPAAIDKHWNRRDGAVEMPNSYSTDPRWNQVEGGMGTPNTYSTDPDPPTPITENINLYNQFIALSIINNKAHEDEPQNMMVQPYIEKENSPMSTHSSMPPLELHKDTNTVSSTLEPETLLPDMVLTLPLPLYLPLEQVVFYNINEHDIISERPEPWRIIHHNIGGDKVLVHAEDFPVEASCTRLEMILQMAMPLISEVKLQHMCLYLKNTIALYANVKCTCTSKTHGAFYNEPYGRATN